MSKIESLISDVRRFVERPIKEINGLLELTGNYQHEDHINSHVNHHSQECPLDNLPREVLEDISNKLLGRNK